jgi:site-specific DNA-methyltransferase (adenine-specific)
MEILNIKAEDYLLGLPSEYIDLTITSPPYDKMRDYNSLFDLDLIAKQLYVTTKKGGVCVWIVGDATIEGCETGTSFKQALKFIENGWKLFDTMIYAKPPRGAVGNNKTYWQSFEYMFVFSKGKPKTINLK